jgi:hypothetical protein
MKTCSFEDELTEKCMEKYKVYDAATLNTPFLVSLKSS